MNKDIKPIDKQGEAHGYWERYWVNGELYRKGYYVHGHKYGLWEKYYHNGVLWSKEYWVHGKRHGLCEEYPFDLVIKDFYLNGMIFFDIYQTSKNKLIL